MGIFPEGLGRAFEPDQPGNALSSRVIASRTGYMGALTCTKRRTMKIIRGLPFLFAGVIGTGVIPGSATPAGASPPPCSVTLKANTVSVKAVVHSGCAGDWLNVYLSLDSTYKHQVGFMDSNNGTPVPLHVASGRLTSRLSRCLPLSQLQSKCPIRPTPGCAATTRAGPDFPGRLRLNRGLSLPAPGHEPDCGDGYYS